MGPRSSVPCMSRCFWRFGERRDFKTSSVKYRMYLRFRRERLKECFLLLPSSSLASPPLPPDRENHYLALILILMNDKIEHLLSARPNISMRTHLLSPFLAFLDPFTLFAGGLAGAHSSGNKMKDLGKKCSFLLPPSLIAFNPLFVELSHLCL